MKNLYVTKYRINGEYVCHYFDSAKEAKALMIGLMRQGMDAICLKAAF